MLHRIALAAVAAAAAAFAVPATAADIALAADGAWHAFAVDSLLAPPEASLGWIDDGGNPIAFTFVVGAGAHGTLTVVDAGFAGDVFAVTNFAASLGSTSIVPVGAYPTAHDAGNDFAAALADPSFSRGVFSLDPGAYRISGRLTQSVLLDGIGLDATLGAVRLDVVTAVPEPETFALLLAGLGATGWVARRRSAARA